MRCNHRCTVDTGTASASEISRNGLPSRAILAASASSGSRAWSAVIVVRPRTDPVFLAIVPTW